MKGVYLPENDIHGLLQRIMVDVVKGIKHGHFDFHISCSGNTNGNRQVTFNAGLTHRYNLNKADLPQNLFPQVTFQQKASSQSVLSLETPPQGAQTALDITNDEVKN